MLEAICISILCVGVTVACVLLLGHAFGLIEMLD